MNKNIGIVGQGFVGTAVREGMKSSFNVLAYDKFVSEKSNSTLLNIVDKCDVIFVCVPTPMNMQTGEAHLGIVKEVVSEIDKLASDLDKWPTMVVKSTVPPGTIEMLNEGFAFHSTVTFNPEFLTEANAVNDFINQDRIIIGADEVASGQRVLEVFNHAFPKVNIQITNTRTAEMVKYTTNCFLATKVSFANEIYNICEKSEIDYNEMISLAKLDKRLGNSHWMVPGPDGDRGYGGHCFPGNYEVVTNEGSITLQEAYQKYSDGENILVNSYNHTLGLKEVKQAAEVTCNEYAGDLYKFTLENGTVLECTPEHLFPISRNGKIVLVQAKNITENDNFHIDSEYIDYNRKTMAYDTKVQ